MSVSTEDLRIDHSGHLQNQLYQLLTQRIVDGRYPPTSMMPSTRLLAADLGISRNTVIAVYDQMKAEGFLSSTPGKGVFINAEIPGNLADRSNDLLAPETIGERNSRFITKEDSVLHTNESQIPYMRDQHQDNNLPFSPGLPDLSAFPVKSWNRIWHHHESRTKLMGYDNPQGYLPLRQAVTNYLRTSRGVRCSPDQVIITNGAQQALSLIADVCLQPGDTVLAEDPGYRGARYALQKKNNQILPVPLQNQVLDTSALPINTNVKLLYCTPTHQYPLGGIMDITGRMSLLNWASENASLIIEDDYDSEFHFYNKPISAVQGICEHSPVLYIGSFSKTLLPAVRIGYLVVPESLVKSFVWMKRISGGETPLLIQAVIAEFIESGQFFRHLRRMRHLYRQKWELFQALVEEHLTGLFHPIAESAGMHLVLEGACDDIALSSQLRLHGFGSAPLSDHYYSSAEKQGLILGFVSASELQMISCLKTLRRLMGKSCP